MNRLSSGQFWAFLLAIVVMGLLTIGGLFYVGRSIELWDAGVYSGGDVCPATAGLEQRLDTHLAWHEEQHAWDNERFEWINSQLSACGCPAPDCGLATPTPSPTYVGSGTPTERGPSATPQDTPPVGPTPTVPAPTETPVDPTATPPPVPTDTPEPEPTATDKPAPTKKPPCNHGHGNGPDGCDPGADPTAANNDGDHTPTP